MHPGWVALIIIVGLILIVVLVWAFMPKVEYKRWSTVLTRSASETDAQWALRIYRSLFNPQAAPTEGGVATIAAMLVGKQIITNDIANSICANPCRWYKDRAGTKYNCDCTVSPAVAANFGK